MPGIGLHSGALEVFADPIDVSKKNLLDYNHHHKNAQREWRWSVMGCEDFAHTFDCKTNRGHKHAQCDNQRSNRLSLAVAVRVRPVWRPCRYGQSAPNHN